MKLAGMTLKRFAPCALTLAALALIFAGCASAPEPRFSSSPELTFTDGGKATSGSNDSKKETNKPRNPNVETFRIGDPITVVFSGVDTPIQPHIERIKEDGTITLPLINSVKAAGRSQGELQKEIHDRYVPKYYVFLTVTVSTADRFYYVSGEVKGPGRQIYTGETTVTKAIASAGDFNDWANKKTVRLTRADGTIIKVNCLKALEDPTQDPVVFPGDKIHVFRKSAWSL
ncbi:MAG: polysaccharide export protein [Verrucomicrobia bacterium]|nr:MAG: polysaccharide export protein [Verrucomicrobiota bacterium]